MGLGPEKRDIYRLPIGHVAWVYEMADSLKGVRRLTRDQWLRASQSMPLKVDFDPDSDFDPEEIKSRQAAALDARSLRR